MPRYYIDLHDGSNFVRDAEGFDLPDAEAARVKLVRIMSRIAGDFGTGDPRTGTPGTGSDRQDYLALVRDGAGRVLFRAHLSLDIEAVDGA